ncbi:MAG TPA: metal-dependent hydrolase [Polyangiaceae bacterium]|nr:metal-dependent hydrolase [Polyangiaceae bacterium]
MDNATHAIVGLLVAEVVIQYRGRRGRVSTAGFLASSRWVSALANNLADLDSLYAKRLGGKLGYLLQHRGYTHTVPAALAIGFTLWAVWLGMRRRALTRADRWWLLVLSLGGALLHIAFDACNNYGVHPFWPLFDGWLYGDCLFIIEPWLWVFAVPALYPALTNRWAKRALGAVLAAGVGLAWLLRIAPWGVALALTLGTLAALRACYRLSSRHRLYFALAGWGAVFVAFAGASRLGRASVARELSARPDEHLEEIVMTPAPGNPLCFSVVTVSTRRGDYLLRAARASALPTVLDAEACRVQATGLTLGLRAPSIRSNETVYWEGDWQRPLDELVGLDASHCLVHALLVFARAPFWKPLPNQRLLLGDLRFDRDPDYDFDELEVPGHPEAGQCLRWIPPWRPPRESLLRGR